MKNKKITIKKGLWDTFKFIGFIGTPILLLGIAISDISKGVSSYQRGYYENFRYENGILVSTQIPASISYFIVDMVGVALIVAIAIIVGIRLFPLVKQTYNKLGFLKD